MSERPINRGRTELTVIEPTHERPSARAARLLAEAKSAAREHMDELEGAMAGVVSLALEIAAGGDAYPAGIRDLCNRIAEEAGQRGQTLGAIMRGPGR